MRFTITLKIICCTSLLLLIAAVMGIYAAIATGGAATMSTDIRDRYVAVSSASYTFADKMLTLRSVVKDYVAAPNEEGYKAIKKTSSEMKDFMVEGVKLAQNPRLKELMPEISSTILKVDEQMKVYLVLLDTQNEGLYAGIAGKKAFLDASYNFEQTVEKLRTGIHEALNRAIAENSNSATTLSNNYEKASNMFRDALKARDAYSNGIAAHSISYMDETKRWLSSARKIVDDIIVTMVFKANRDLAIQAEGYLKIMEQSADVAYKRYTESEADFNKRARLNDELVNLNEEIGRKAFAELAAVASRAAASMDRSNKISEILVVVMVIAGLCILFFLYTTVMKPLNRFVVMVGSLTSGDGDLTSRVPANGKDELSDLAVNFNKFIENVQEIIVEVKRGTDELASANNELASTMEELSTTFNSQTEEVSGIVNDMDTVRNGSKDSVNDLNTCLTIMNTASEETDKGASKLMEVRSSISAIHEKAESLSESISRLSGSSTQIGDILNVINDIADQTNLLALNAAIEAARAGDAGRGFAVVADEVRKLAERTQKATSEIETIISSLLKESENASTEMAETASVVNEGVKVIDETSKNFEQVISKIYNVRENTTSIVGTVTGQFDTIQAVSDRTQVVASGVEESNAAVSEVNITVSHLQKMTEKLKSMVERFKS